MENFLKKTPIIHKIETSLFQEKEVSVYIKRDDLIHPLISGNKWRKLKYNLIQAKKLGQKNLLTFGGAYSNHIAAVAAVGAKFGFKTIGIVRGEEQSNTTLRWARHNGMYLHFVDRLTYKQKNTPDYIKYIQQKFGNCYILPEGGTNQLALLGCAEIIEELYIQLTALPNYIFLACGTGGTTAGIIKGMAGYGQVLSVSALKGNFLKNDIQQLLNVGDIPYTNWEVLTNYHFGGYAKFKPELIDFINTFFHQFKIPLDPIYTGKATYALFDYIKKDFFPRGSQIVLVHTGGLQGIAGFNQRFGQLIDI